MLTKIENWLFAPFITLQYKWLTYRLRSKNLDTRGRAIRALGQLQDQRAIPLIIPLLQQQDSFIRYSASNALGQLKDSQGIEPLLAAHARESDPYTRMWMAVDLMYLGNVDPIESLFEDIAIIDAEGKEDWDSGPIISMTIAHLGEQVLPSLAKALTHPNSAVRWIVVMALDEMNNEQAIDVLKQAQHDEDEFIREEVNGILEEWVAR